MTPGRICCPGCKTSVKITGFLNHVRLSKNLLCNQAKNAEGDSQSDSESDTESLSSAQASVDEEHGFLLRGLDSANFGPESAHVSDNEGNDTAHPIGPALGIDPTGDYYGDYSHYDPLDFEMDIEEGEMDLDEEAARWLEGDVATEEPEIEDDRDEVESEEVCWAQLECGLEPNRPNRMDTDTAEEEEEDAPRLATTADRDGVEEKLHHQPFVVPFPRQIGAPIPWNRHSKIAAHARYAESVRTDNDSPNIYAPFSSRLEWDVARWAKLRGPSSTLFTELISIPGVNNSEAIVDL